MDSRVDDIWDRILARIPRIPSSESLGSSLPDISSEDSTQFELELDNDDEINDRREINNRSNDNSQELSGEREPAPDASNKENENDDQSEINHEVHIQYYQV